MQQKKILCLLIGNNPHHLDHLAPMAIELDLPLFVIEQNIYILAKKYYPNINVVQVNFFQLIAHHLKEFDKIISCFPVDVLKTAFSSIKDLEYYWLPHGYSDKGKTQEKYFRMLAEEDNILLYGQNFVEKVRESGALDKTNHYIIKNYRYYHYLKNKEFYDTKIEALNIHQQKPVLLYAPTWKDTEGSSSFLRFSSHLKKMKKEYQIVCKWHPNLLVQDKKKIEKLEKKHPEICFLHDFTPIYSLLSICSLYVGDTSSIGYDFLTFTKPMVFLSEHNRNLPLFSCGKVLVKKDYKQIEKAIKEAITLHKLKYLPMQKKIYDFTFGKKEPLEGFNQYFQKLKHEFSTTEKNTLNTSIR